MWCKRVASLSPPPPPKSINRFPTWTGVKYMWQKHNFYGQRPLPSTDATLWPWTGDAASPSGAAADGCLTWQERMINCREEARARVDEVMLSSWLSLIGLSWDRDHNTSFVGGMGGVRARLRTRAAVCECVRAQIRYERMWFGGPRLLQTPLLFYSLQTREAPAVTACLQGKPGHPWASSEESEPFRHWITVGKKFAVSPLWIFPTTFFSYCTETAGSTTDSDWGERCSSSTVLKS